MFHNTITIMSLNRISITIFAVIAIFVLPSCQSHEERVIDKLESLSKHIDTKGKNFDADDWKEAMEELADIHEEMTECDFTPEQLKEVGRADGRLTAIIAREGAKALGHGFSDAIKSLGFYAKGFQEGAEENISDNDFDDVVNELNDAVESVIEEWKE